MPLIETVMNQMADRPARWLVTGAAGFIGSHLTEALLRCRQEVVGLDSFATGSPGNLDEIRNLVGDAAWKRFQFYEADIRDLEACRNACHGVDFVLHQAALGSVPRSISDPLASHQTNVDGFVNMLVAAKESGVRRLVFASSSSVYGSLTELPNREDRVGSPLSPYAATKCVNEIYAKVFAQTYGFTSIGLRYFNVFGARQSPEGPYAAVIPRWVRAMLQHIAPQINGDGSISRDFCYIANVVQANLLAAAVENPEALNQIYNVACGDQTTLSQLYGLLQTALSPFDRQIEALQPTHNPPRLGDLARSRADISRAKELLGYAPQFDVRQGISSCIAWYVGNYAAESSVASDA